MNWWYMACVLFLFNMLNGCAALSSMAESETALKYNYYNKEWSYEHQESRLMYNYLENRWEYAK